MTQKWIIFWGYKNKNDEKNSLNKQKNKHLFLSSNLKGLEHLNSKVLTAKPKKLSTLNLN